MSGTATSRAVVAAAPSQLEIRDLPRAPLEPTDVLISTAYSGISNGTDRWIVTGRFLPGMTFPLIPGYQRSGVVEEIGSAVTRFRPGQKVAATQTTGLPNPYSGGHVGFAASAEADVYDATGVDPRAASLFVVAQVGYNAASRILSPAGSRVLVIGDGVIGACGALAAHARGFEVMCVGRHDDRLEAIAGANPAVRTLNSRSGDVSGIAEWMPVAAIDTVQSDTSFGYYIDVLPHGKGEVVFSGHSPDGVQTWGSMMAMQAREVTAHFVSGWNDERLLASLALMRDGRFPVERLVGRVARGAEETADVMAGVAAGTLPAVATVIEWNAT